MRSSDTSRGILISFDVLSDADDLKAEFYSLELPVKCSLEWIETAAVPAANELMEKMEFKVLGNKSALKDSQPLTHKHLVVREIKTPQIHWVSEASYLSIRMQGGWPNSGVFSMSFARGIIL